MWISAHLESVCRKARGPLGNATVCPALSTVPAVGLLSESGLTRWRKEEGAEVGGRTESLPLRGRKTPKERGAHGHSSYVEGVEAVCRYVFVLCSYTQLCSIGMLPLSQAQDNTAVCN